VAKIAERLVRSVREELDLAHKRSKTQKKGRFLAKAQRKNAK
jgi:hypothetical protein